MTPRKVLDTKSSIPPILQLDILRCRAMGHRWEEYNPSIPTLSGVRGYRLSYRCEGCATSRHDVYAALTGQLLDRDYWHPDSYFMVGGASQPSSRREWKVLYIAARKEMDRLKDKGVDLEEPRRLRVVGG